MRRLQLPFGFDSTTTKRRYIKFTYFYLLLLRVTYINGRYFVRTCPTRKLEEWLSIGRLCVIKPHLNNSQGGQWQPAGCIYGVGWQSGLSVDKRALKDARWVVCRHESSSVVSSTSFQRADSDQSRVGCWRREKHASGIRHRRWSRRRRPAGRGNISASTTIPVSSNLSSCRVLPQY